MLVVQHSTGFAYAPWFGPSPSFSMLKVNSSIDLDGPQLDFAAAHPHVLRYWIDPTNTWAPAGHFWTLPQQLWPVRDRQFSLALHHSCQRQSATAQQHLQNKIYAYDEAGAPMLGPPRKGVWRSNQVVYTALNVTVAGPDDAPLGWRCVEGGRPGRWVPLGGK